MKKERIYNGYGEIELRERTPGQDYDRVRGGLVPVTPELAAENRSYVSKVRGKAWRRGTCSQPDYTRCSGDCDGCPFQRRGAELSWEALQEESGYEENEARGDADTCGSESAGWSSTETTDRLLLGMAVRQLLERLRETDPAGARLCELYMQEKTEEEMAAELDVHQTTVSRRLEKLFARLAREWGPELW